MGDADRMEGLIDSLTKACDRFEQLEGLLQREGEQLRFFDAQELLRTVAAKGPVLDQLSQACATARANLAEVAPAGEENLSLQELIPRVPPLFVEPLRDTWQQILLVSRRIRTLQERNRTLIEEGLAFCEETLGFLQEAMYPAPSLYAPTNKPRAGKPRPARLRREV
jgi:flagellar biosynthesis/type III secretory pathway chaperone